MDTEWESHRSCAEIVGWEEGKECFNVANNISSACLSVDETADLIAGIQDRRLQRSWSCASCNLDRPMRDCSTENVHAWVPVGVITWAAPPGTLPGFDTARAVTASSRHARSG
jgi:hypothetical protein